MLARVASRRAAREIVRSRCGVLAFTRPQLRSYGDYHSVEDMLTASDAWHSLVPERILNDPDELWRTFNKLDLDGNGKISASELCVALISKQGLPPAGFSQFILDAQVDSMISWADHDKDGMISFDEYKKVIQAGCMPHGSRKQPPNAGSRMPSDVASQRPEPIITYGDDDSVIYL